MAMIVPSGLKTGTTVAVVHRDCPIAPVQRHSGSVTHTAEDD